MALDRSQITFVKPLKKRSAEGKLYTRPRNVELQLAEVVTFNESEILRRLMVTDKKDTDYILDETLVYLFREAHREENHVHFERMFEFVNRRIARIAEGGWTNALPEHEKMDVAGYVWQKFVEQVLDLENNSGDYAQIRFGDYISTHASAYRIKKLAEINSEKDHDRIDDHDPDGHNNDPQFKRISEVELSILKEGIDSLSEEMKTVVWLIADGWKVESKDPDEPTICRQMNVTSRTIRNWISEARTQLAGYRGIGR